MSRYIARHRFATRSHLVRNAGVGLATVGVVAGSVAPAQAFAVASPVESVLRPAPSASTLTSAAAPAHAYPSANPNGDIWAQNQVASIASATAASTLSNEGQRLGDTAGLASDSATPAHAYPSANPNGDIWAQVPDNISTADGASAEAHGDRAKIIEDAMAGLGGSYIWGGKSFMAWDCSGFVSYVYAQSGINLDAYTYTMKDQLTQTSTPQPGDIVFTNNYAHVGIYLGNGQMISALNPTQGTVVTPVDGGGMMSVDGYYKATGL